MERMCCLFQLSRSGYSAWLKRNPGKRRLSNELLDKKITSIFTQHHKRYGYPRITQELRAIGEICSKNRVYKRMKLLNIQAKAKRKYKATTDSHHSFAVAPNVLNRNFTASRPNEKYVGDITYIWTEEGWLYLATVIDLYSRAVIGWSIQPTMTSQLVRDALMMALWRRGFPRGVIFHSDRGSQYCSSDFQKLLKFYKLTSSMSRKSNCWDNSVAESFFKTIKSELIYTQRYQTRELAKQSIFHYIETYYNRIRRHSAIGYLSPNMYESQYQIVA